MVMSVVPMFPLGLSLLPGQVLPLYLFEERYRRLYSDLATGDGRFGIVLIERGTESRDDSPTFRIGCIAQLVGSAVHEDGTISIATVGTERIKVVEWLDPDPYPRAAVQSLPEGTATPAGELCLAAAIARLPRLYALESELYEGPRSTVPDFLEDPVSATYQLANAVDLQPLDVQRILEAETADDRIDVVARLLDELIDFTELQLRAG